jgi:hypothetical protein
MSSDERQQSTALLVANLVLCLWLSHCFNERFPQIPGAINLQQWIRFWNKPLVVHWPCTAILFILITILAKRIKREMTLSALRKQREEALLLKKHLNPSEDDEPHKPIL